MISVVIPTFNRSAFVKEAVASALAQVNVDMEVIVVDDGSTDDTGEVLRDFGDRITVYRQENAGVSSARNTGIRNAKGDWIALLDSDDLWLPRKLSAQSSFLSVHPEFGICQTEEIWVRNGRRVNPKKHHKKPDGHCFADMLERCLVSPSAVMIHRDIFLDVGLFDESLPACEDYDMWLRIGLRYPIGLLREALTIKRGGHADQLSASTPALDRYRIRSLAGLLGRETLNRDQQELVLSVIEKKSHIYGIGCLRRGRVDEAQTVRSLARNLRRELQTADASAPACCIAGRPFGE